MALKNSAVFRFILDIRDFLIKGRQASEVLNKISGNSQKASSSVEQLGTTTQKTGQNMTAAAVNFQTATQGMLNLSTAAVQTFTSFSNLDRAGNRLAQSQIAVSRAQDLLNNKQLRLNELQASGAGHTQKAINLSNELATARADLLVKTDKLKIEEGALFDIQLLFATNVANVMISSLQTIKTLKDLHVASTIKQVIQEKLLSTTIFTKSVPSWVALTGAQGGYDIVANKVINTNRLLLVGIPVVGAALLGVSLAVQAYTENWGGFRDMIQKVLPFMRDQKELLGDVQEELGKAGDAADGFTNSLDKQSELLFKLPQQYRLAKESVESYARAYGAATKEAHKLNTEVGKNPQVFRQASSEGGIIVVSEKEQPITSSNVIKHEGDSRFTASSISNSSMNMDVIRFMSANAVASVNPRIAATPTQPLVANFNNEIFRKGSVFDYLNFFEPSTRAAGGVRDIGSALERQIGGTINTVDHATKQAASNINLSLKKLGVDLRIPTSFGDFFNKLGAGLSRDLRAVDMASRGVNLKEFEQIRAIQKLIQSQIGDNFYAPNMRFGYLDPNRSRGQFIGGGAFFPGVTSGGFLGTEQLTRTIEERNKLIEELNMISAEGTGKDIAKHQRALEIFSLLQVYNPAIRKGTRDPNIVAGILLQDKLRQQANLETFIVDPDNPQAFQDYMSKLAQKRSDVATRNLMQVLEGEIKQSIQQDLVRDAAALGLTPEDLVFRRRVGGAGGITPGISGIGKDIFLGFKPTADQLSFLESAGKVVRYMGSTVFGGQDIFKPKKVLEAEAIRLQELAGNNLVDNTPHDRLVKAAFGARNMFGPGHRLGGFKFGSAGGTLNMAYQGLILSKDDPLLKDTSNMGEKQLAVFMETGVDIGGVAESISMKEGLRLAKQERYIAKNFANTTGGYADVAIAYLNNQTKISEWGQMATMNDLMSSKHSFANVAAGRVMGSTNYFGSGFFKSTGASGARQVARGSIRVPWREAQIQIEDRNRNRMRTGGRRVLNEDGTPMYDLWDDRAVEGGFTSISAYRQDWWKSFRSRGQEAFSFIEALGGDTSVRFAAGGGKTALNRAYSRVINQATETRSLLARTGLSISMLPSRGDFGFRRGGGGFGNVSMSMARAMRQSINNRYNEARSATIAANQLTLKRAGQIDLLIGGFGLDSYYGSGLGLQQLQLDVQKQDQLIQSIGLNRTEAFRIIDTQGRGRNEIDDRVRWTQRNESISTGNIVL